MTRRFIAALLFSGSAVALIFIVYEIVERTWLKEIYTEELHYFHMGRGILGSIVGASLMGWFIMRSSLPLLAATPSEEEWAKGTRPSDLDRLTHYIQWFILMRWIAVVVVTAVVFVIVWVAHLLPPEVGLPLIITICVLAGTNIVYDVMLKRGLVTPLLLFAQVYCDLIILTSLLHFSGGIENPIALLMLLHVIIGGIVLSRRQCYTVAAVGSALYMLLALAEGLHVMKHYTLQIFPHFVDAGVEHHAANETLYVGTIVGLQTSILFFTAYFVTTLSDRARKDEKQLAAMANRAEGDHRLLSQSLETTNTGLRVLDSDFQPRWTNVLWSKWFETLSKGSTADEQLNGVKSAATRTLHDGKVRTTELTIVDQMEDSGTAKRVFRITTAAITDPHTSTRQVVELAQDVTDLKEVHAQLVRASQLAAVGELAGHVAHEVNNPIAIISAKARLLLSDRRDECSDEIAAELKKIVELSDRVAQIAKGLLSSSRPSGASHHRIAIAGTVQKALAMVEQRARTSKIEIVESIPDNLPDIHANAQELEQVFLNLFINSLDAMPSGGTLTISVNFDSDSISGAEKYLNVVVEDTGGGIPKSNHNLVFEPFFTTKDEGKGTGLGLSICQGLISSHGGYIELDNVPNVGARFSIYLPVGKKL